MNTEEKILKAAAALFVKGGFEGISISQIAKAANINQSLIYHYFESKEALWKSVKNYFVEAYASKEDLKLDSKNGLKSLLKQIIYSRFEFYEKHPEVVRMAMWQRLETDKNKLIGGTLFSPDNWKGVFAELQKQGEIKKEVNLDRMVLFITSLVDGALSGGLKEKKSYLDLIISSCVQIFGN